MMPAVTMPLTLHPAPDHAPDPDPDSAPLQLNVGVVELPGGRNYMEDMTTVEVGTVFSM